MGGPCARRARPADHAPQGAAHLRPTLTRPCALQSYEEHAPPSPSSCGRGAHGPRAICRRRSTGGARQRHRPVGPPPSRPPPTPHGPSLPRRPRRPPSAAAVAAAAAAAGRFTCGPRSSCDWRAARTRSQGSRWAHRRAPCLVSVRARTRARVRTRVRVRVRTRAWSGSGLGSGLGSGFGLGSDHAPGVAPTAPKGEAASAAGVAPG